MDRGTLDHLIEKRFEIVDEIKGIRVQQSQSLREVRVSDHTLRLANAFIKKAPNVCDLGAGELYLRYEVLHSFSVGTGYGVYQLLADDAGDSAVQVADAKFEGWLKAVGNLQRYAFNLLLAPKRPEFQTIKVSRVRTDFRLKTLPLVNH